MAEKKVADLEQGFDIWLKKMDYLKARSIHTALKLAWMDGVRFGAAKIAEEIEKMPANPFADRLDSGNGEDKLPEEPT